MKLTRREVEVLRLIAHGMTTRQVALHLGIGQATVRTHVEHTLEKLDVSTRAAAVARALALGLLREDIEAA